MITPKKANDLIDLTLGHAGRRVSGCEVTVTSSDIATSRFANSSMTQNQAPDRTELAVRVQGKGRQVRLASDNLSPKAVRQLVDSAITALGYLEEDPTVLPMIGRHRKLTAAPNRYDRATALMSPADRAAAVKRIIREASGLDVAGVVATGSTFTAIGNSRGLLVSHRESVAECSITAAAGADTGWSKASHVRFADLGIEELARQAALKARLNTDPVEIAPGKYTVILEPAAVLDLLWFLVYDFAATSHIDKQSCFLGKLGKQVLGKNIHITDDPYHPLQSGAPFDGEGNIRKAVELVRSGVLENIVYGRKAAEKLGAASTGHGLPEPNAEGEMPVNLVMAGGDTSLADMIAGTDRGVILTRVWYVRDMDPTTKLVTGMTRDGTFLVENGKLTRAVKNLRFNQGLLEMLNNVVAASPAVRTAGEEAPTPQVVPALKVSNFNFASTTTF